jgi:hypothetical protein
LKGHYRYRYEDNEGCALGFKCPFYFISPDIHKYIKAALRVQEG